MAESESSDGRANELEEEKTDSPKECEVCLTQFAPTEMAVRMGTTHLHERCYNCAQCGEPLGEKPVHIFKMRPYHPECWVASSRVCRTCQTEIPNGEMRVNYNEMVWHLDCFVCGTCKKTLRGMIPTFRFGQVFHDNCLGATGMQTGYLLPTGELCNTPITLHEHTPNAQTLAGHPLVQVIPSFFTAEECSHLIELATPLLHPSETGVVSINSKGSVSNDRTSSSAFIDMDRNDSIMMGFMERAAKIMGGPVENMSRPHVGHYSPGQRFQVHYDTYGLKDAETIMGGFQRVSTLLVYLNNVECDEQCTGTAIASSVSGHTQFPLLGISVPPLKGAGLHFRNTTAAGDLYQAALHRGVPVCCGEKWITNLWMYNRPLVDGVVTMVKAPESSNAPDFTVPYTAVPRPSA